MSAEVVAVEVDITDADLGPVRAKCLGEMISAAPRPTVNPARHAALSELLRQRGISEADVTGLHPFWVLSWLASTDLQAWKPQFGIDLQLVAAAKKAGKQVVPLETVCEATQAMVTWGYPLLSDALLDEMMVTLPKRHGPVHMQSLQTAWLEGHEASAQQAYARLRTEGPLQLLFHETVLVQRNKYMAKRLQDLTRGYTNVVVVLGMDHVLMRPTIIDDMRTLGWITVD